MTEGWLWTGQFPECKRVIEQGNNQSMELDKDLIDAHWTKDVNGKNKFFIINEAIMSKLCILGEDIAPAFEGASITAPKIEFSYDEDFKTKMFSLMEEIKNIVKEGGTNNMENENKDLCPECGKPLGECTCGAPLENTKKDVCPECGKPLDECVCNAQTENACGENKEDDKKVKYNLEEIAEYVELKNTYENLKNELETLKTDYSNLKAEYETLEGVNKELSEFKANAVKAEKQEMINSFSMLSDEDKKDVVDHINEYSLDDIEAKLSVICVRKKVNFAGTENNAPIVYNLNNAEDHQEMDAGPAWLDSVISVTKNK